MSHWIREAVLWVGAALGVLSVIGAVAVIGLGYSLLIFRSGSMGPEIPTGSLALSRSAEASDLRIGDVVTVQSAAGARVTHRIVEVDSTGDVTGLTLKGDANGAPDDETYEVTSVPRVVGSVPVVGYVVARVLSPLGLLVVGGLGLALLVLGLRSDRDDGRRPGRRRRDTRPSGATTRRRSNGGRVAVMGAASAVAMITGVTVTDAAFTDNATATTTASSARYFTCNSAMSQTGLAPWAYYKFDEAAPLLSLGTPQTAADSSGGGRNAQYRPNYLLSQPPYRLAQARACRQDAGTAVLFNGSTTAPSYASSTNDIATQQGTVGARWNTFTVSTWFKTSSTESSGNLISMGNLQTGSSGSHDRHLYLSSAGNLVFGVYPGEVREVASTGTDWADNQWHMATASLSGTGMKLWVDGKPVSSRADVTTAQQMTSMFWRIGYDNVQGWGQPTGNAFGGTMDEVGIWTRALSDTEVLDLYRSARPNP